jgi:hypothetical protein
MRILIEGRNLSGYLAKCHEAFRTGLRATFDARCFGEGYPGFDPDIKTYSQMLKHVFPDGEPDVIILGRYEANTPAYEGLADVAPIKGLILSDYWVIRDEHFDEFVQLIERNRIDFILSYFPQPGEIWGQTSIQDRFIYFPVSFDPAIFKDWKVPRTHDVGFLAYGTAFYSPFYPERYRIHTKLLENRRIRYLWAEHPGFEIFKEDHPLVGENFSRAMNSCRIFITTGSQYRNPHAKYVESIASKTTLLADEPLGAEGLRLKDGVNYVRMTEETIFDLLDYYLPRQELCEQIAEQGYRTAMQYHTCYARARDFEKIMTERFPSLWRRLN